MATSDEIKYIFTGDVSSLKDATSKAIGMLDQYGNEIRKVSQNSQLSKTGQVMRNIAQQAGMLARAANVAGAAMRQIGSSSRFDGVRKQITTLVTAVSSKLGALGVQFDPIIQRMRSIRDTSASSFGRLSAGLSTVAAAFRRTSQAADADGEALNRVGTRSRDLEQSSGKLRSALSKLGDAFKHNSQRAKDMVNSFNLLEAAAKALRVAFGALIAFKLGQMFAEGVREAVHYTEVLNMFTVVMGESLDVGKEFVSTMQEVYGLDPTTIMEHTSMFYQLASAVETPTEAARQMAIGLEKLSINLASLFDVDVDKVAENLASGMQGMTRAVRKYGADIRMSTLETTALSLGIKMQAETTSEANRQGLRYLTLMRQLRVAQGDWAKTIESPANQLRIMKEQIQQLARAIGNLFIPILQKVLPLINGFIMALRTIINFFAELIGVSIPTFGGAVDAADDLASSTADVGDEAAKTGKKLKQLMAPFDELNVLQEEAADAGGGGGLGGLGSELMDPRIAQAIKDMETDFEAIEMKANQVRDSILEFFGFNYADVFNPQTGEIEKKLVWVSDQFRVNLVEKFPMWKKTINATFENWDEIIAAVGRLGVVLFEAFQGIFTPIISWLVGAFSSIDWDTLFATFITELPDKLNGISDWIENNTDMFYVLIGLVTGVVSAFMNWDKIVAVAKVLGTVASYASKLLGVLNPVTIAVGLVVGAFALAYVKFQSVRDAVSDLKDGFDELVTSVTTMVTNLWEKVLKPIVENIMEILDELWEKHLSKLVENIGLAVADIIDFILAVMDVFADIINQLVVQFGPTFADIFNSVLTTVGTVVGAVIDLINSLLNILRGILKFLTGVFQGDWKKAWEGIVLIFQGVFGGLGAIAKGVVNVVIDMINGMIKVVWGAIADAVNAIMDLIDSGAELIGLDIDIRMPRKPPKIPHLAQGGVVSSPTVAMIGEGRYDEAVIPLGNSPQMQDMINQITKAIGARSIPVATQSEAQQPVDVRVFIGDKEWDAFTYKSSERGRKIVGRQPIVT